MTTQTISRPDAIAGKCDDLVSAAVCEAMGWKKIQKIGLDHEWHGWIEPGPLEPLPSHADPSRIESLGNMAIALKTIPPELHDKYADTLWDNIDAGFADDDEAYFMYLTADPRQQAVAFLDIKAPEVWEK